MDKLKVRKKPKNNKQLEGTLLNVIPHIDKGTEYPTFRKNLNYYISSYCSSTSIHGIKYLGERGRLIIEKLVWIIIIIIVSVCCTYLILKVYYKWKTMPVIITYATTERPIWEIPFPAVTICPEVKSDPEVFNFTDTWKKRLFLNATDKEYQFYKTFLLLCHNFVVDHGDVMDNTKVVDESVIYNLLKAEPDLDPLNKSQIFWLGEKYKIGEILFPVFTKEGICYSFNALRFDEIIKNPDMHTVNNASKRHRWSLDFGYSYGKTKDDYPRRAFLSGAEAGFFYASMYANHSHLDYICKESFQGFKVMLHHPIELPDSDKYFRVPLDTFVSVGITPRMTIVSKELIKYKPEERMCYFSSERQLAYFFAYTQQNCLNECFANYTLKACGCIEFYMARDPICGPGSNKCVETSKVEYLLNNKTNCNCLPGCTALEYDVEISQGPWDWKMIFLRLLKIDKSLPLGDFINAHFSSLQVYYKDLYFLPTERKELFGTLNFLSNIGGLLGLFIGISTTSLIEILYFLTIRLYCNFKKFGIKLWSGQTSLTHK